MPQQALSFYNIIHVERKEESGGEKGYKYKEIGYVKVQINFFCFTL